MDNRLDGGRFDAALHLLDRQVVDRDGLLVCKVDDLELSYYDDGSPAAVTRVLAGNAALVPRMSSRTGHWLRGRWISLGVQYADRDVPLSFPLGAIEHLGSGVELNVRRDGLLDRQPPPPPGVSLRRMGELLGMHVVTEHPELRGQILDVRLEATRKDRWEVRQLVVGPGRPGSLLGYDRGDFNGPWLVQAFVERLHRHVRLIDGDAVTDVDWEAGLVRIAADADVEGASLTRAPG
jgi:sporulation protein YlmC with PRC-barrel domain